MKVRCKINSITYIWLDNNTNSSSNNSNGDSNNLKQRMSMNLVKVASQQVSWGLRYWWCDSLFVWPIVCVTKNTQRGAPPTTGGGGGGGGGGEGGAWEI